MKAYLFAVLVTILCHSLWAGDKSVEVTLEGSPVQEQPRLSDADLARYKAYATELRSKLDASFARGKAAAQSDIKVGRFRLRAFGKSVGKHEIDSVTGYPIERIGLRSNPPFSDAEVNGYNSTMREWHAKQLRRRRSNQALQPTAPLRHVFDVDLS